MLLDFNLSGTAKDTQHLLGGTLPYMSSEQLRATDPDGSPGVPLLDGRSDISRSG